MTNTPTYGNPSQANWIPGGSDKEPTATFDGQMTPQVGIVNREDAEMEELEEGELPPK